MPSTLLAANAVCRTPMTRPRICIGYRSVTIAKTTEPTTPANTPVTILASQQQESSSMRVRTAASRRENRQ